MARRLVSCWDTRQFRLDGLHAGDGAVCVPDHVAADAPLREPSALNDTLWRGATVGEDKSWSGAMIATAILLPVAVNLFTSLFSGAVAIVIMLIALFVATFLMRGGGSKSQGARASIRVSEWRVTFRRTGAMILIGALFGGVCVLPIFPARSIRIPILNDLANLVSQDLPGFVMVNGYEILAASMIAIGAALSVFRGRSIVTALEFVLAASAGAIAVFVAVRGYIDFTEPWLTWLGMVVSVGVVAGVAALSPAVLETVRHVWGTEPTSDESRADVDAIDLAHSEFTTRRERRRGSRT